MPWGLLSTHDQEDLPIKAWRKSAGSSQTARLGEPTDDATVIPQIPVQDGHADVKEDPMGALIQQQPAEHFQTVGVDIELVEMV